MTVDSTTTNIIIIILAATAFNGILAGSSLDQSIKQLPARHTIGAKVFSIYSQASDLANGKIWYSIIGIGAASLTVAAALAMFYYTKSITTNAVIPVYFSAAFSVAHSIITAKAASTNFQQRKVFEDEHALIGILDYFERLQAIRAILQALSFCGMLVSLFFWAQ